MAVPFQVADNLMFISQSDRYASGFRIESTGHCIDIQSGFGTADLRAGKELLDELNSLHRQ
jgi:hypothetical protein